MIWYHTKEISKGEGGDENGADQTTPKLLFTANSDGTIDPKSDGGSTVDKRKLSGTKKNKKQKKGKTE
eukprot:Pgem_evm2s16983